MNPRLPAWLAERLQHPLPGATIHERFSPRPNPWPDEHVIPAEVRPAAVLILLYPHAGAWHIPFILRPIDSTVHSGQICLPGGAVEPGETSAEAALREYREELGDAGDVELLGSLSPWHVRASNYLIALGSAIQRSGRSSRRMPWKWPRILRCRLGISWIRQISAPTSVNTAATAMPSPISSGRNIKSGAQHAESSASSSRF